MSVQWETKLTEHLNNLITHGQDVKDHGLVQFAETALLRQRTRELKDQIDILRMVERTKESRLALDQLGEFKSTANLFTNLS